MSAARSLCIVASVLVVSVTVRAQNLAHHWSQRFGDANSQRTNSVVTDASGDIFIVGNFWGTVDFGGLPLVSAGITDVYVAKFDADGNHMWSLSFGDRRECKKHAIHDIIESM